VNIERKEESNELTKEIVNYMQVIQFSETIIYKMLNVNLSKSQSIP